MTSRDVSLLMWCLCAVWLSFILAGVIARHPEEHQAHRLHWAAAALGLSALLVLLLPL